jgi:hypothetical protein
VGGSTEHRRVDACVGPQTVPSVCFGAGTVDESEMHSNCADTMSRRAFAGKNVRGAATMHGRWTASATVCIAVVELSFASCVALT